MFLINGLLILWIHVVSNLLILSLHMLLFLNDLYIVQYLLFVLLFHGWIFSSVHKRLEILRFLKFIKLAPLIPTNFDLILYKQILSQQLIYLILIKYSNKLMKNNPLILQYFLTQKSLINLVKILKLEVFSKKTQKFHLPFPNYPLHFQTKLDLLYEA